MNRCYIFQDTGLTKASNIISDIQGHSGSNQIHTYLLDHNQFNISHPRNFMSTLQNVSTCAQIEIYDSMCQ